eukprot:6209120-Prymnesium_polylepis.1
MGSALGRTAAAAAPPAKAAFPAPPRVPQQATPAAFAQGEVEHGRNVASLFREADIQSAPSSSVGMAEATIGAADEEVPRLKTDDFVHALLLHSQDPARHSVTALAMQFGVSKENIPTLEAALEHCVPYRVVEVEGEIKGGDTKLFGEAVTPTVEGAGEPATASILSSILNEERLWNISLSPLCRTKSRHKSDEERVYFRSTALGSRAAPGLSVRFTWSCGVYAVWGQSAKPGERIIPEIRVRSPLRLTRVALGSLDPPLVKPRACPVKLAGAITSPHNASAAPRRRRERARG